MLNENQEMVLFRRALSVLFFVVIFAWVATVSSQLDSSRLVITFLTAKDNNFSLDSIDSLGSLGSLGSLSVGGTSATVVKRYGRRLVLDLGAPFDLEAERARFAGALRSVQSVETDFLVGVSDVPLTPLTPQYMVSDALMVLNATDPNNTNNPNVDGAYISPATQTPLWNLMDSEPYSIHAEGVWQVTNSTPDVVVAVLDTGIADPARSMFLNLLDGYDFISDDGISIDGDGRDPDPTDPGDWGDMCPTPSWHGTKVASILAARHDNEFGMKGVAQNCSVLPVRVLGLCRMGYATDVTDAIVWAAGGAINGVPANPSPAKIISLSLAGQGSCPDYLQSAVTQAVSLGAMVVAAAGNSNQNVSNYFPANCNGVIAVAASTRDGKLAAYSNWGSLIAVSAPGGDQTNGIMTLGVNSLETGLEVSYGMGTSFAAPHISGVGALVGVASLSGVLKSWKKIVFNNVNSTIKICTSEACSAQIISKIMSNFSGVYAVQNACAQPDVWQVCGAFDGTIPLTCSQCTCPAGSWLQGGSSGNWLTEICNSCAACPGQYRSGCGGSSAGSCLGCAACGVGSYWSVACTGTTAGTCVGCAACGGGKYWSVACTGTTAGTCASCAACPNGQVRSGCSGTSAGTCGNCAAGSYSVSGSTSCTPCAAGSYSAAGASSCTPCAAGTFYGTTGATACTPCPIGKYYGTTGATACTACAAGSYFGTTGATACTPCAAGTFYGTTGATACTTCNAGYYSAASSIACTECTAGRYSGSSGATSSSACVNCLYGTYSSNGASVCTDCAPGTTSFNGAASCSACPVGMYSVNTYTCYGCDAGKYFGGTGASSSAQCLQCSAGSYSETAASSCTTCTSTNYCAAGSTSQTPCPAGSYCPTPSTINTCPQNAYCPGGVTIQTLCPAGTLGAATGTSTISNCVACPIGMYSGLGATSCSACAAGTYNDVATGLATCKTCTAIPFCNTGLGLYKKSCTATSDAVCTSCGTSNPPYSLWNENTIDTCTWYCQTTPVLYYKTGSTCTACKTPSSCSTGNYVTTCTASADGTCTPCTNKPALNSIYTSNSPSYDTSACPWSCNSGYSQGASACSICAAGSYASGSPTVCSNCPAGTYSGTAGASSSSTCTSCGAGTYSAATGASSSSACTACGAGKFSATVGATISTVCNSCPAGTYSGTSVAADSSTCTSCGVGTYSAASGATSIATCTNCPAGTYSGTSVAVDSSTCTSCGAGTYSAASGATSIATCTNCAAGTSSAALKATGIATCNACTAGTYSLAGAAACLSCSSTSYTPTTGASTCTLCPLCTTNGYFRSGCSGTAVGTCEKCTNTA